MILTRDGKEIVAIYKQNGDEVDEVKDANGRIIYTNTREITGTLPLSFTSRGKPLSDYRISGNTMQDGTPSPEAPVDVVGCGEKTAQLFEDKIASCSIDASGRLISNSDFDMYLAKVEQGETYTASAQITGGFFATKPVIGSTSYNKQRMTFALQTVTAPITGYMTFRVNSGGVAPMFNLGSTAMPYEPYGYKLPLTNGGGTTTNVYLGETQSTRQIKKLVLTGEEEWGSNTSGSLPFFYLLLSDIASIGTAVISTHFQSADVGQKTTEIGIGLAGGGQLRVRPDDPTSYTLASWKGWLSTNQPTIWYVLAEPETGIVNAPLMKIGDYADTVSMTQAGVTIPTASGANVLDMTSPVKPSEVYIKGKGIKAIT